MTTLTILSDMALSAGDDNREPGPMIDRAASLGLATLDLKTVMGRNVADLSTEQAGVLDDALRARGMGVEAFSTQLFRHGIEEGEAVFARDLAAVDHVLRLAGRMHPRFIRLLAAETQARPNVPDAIDLIQSEASWLIAMYGEAVDRIHAAGFQTVIENEIAGCIFSRPSEVLDFFAALNRPGRVKFTYDVQNLWEMGTAPTLTVYRSLRPVMGYLHVKGGRAGPDGRLAWRSPLATASWPVAEIVRAAVADGVSPCICLNPSHGAVASGETRDDYTREDLAFLWNVVGDTG